MKKTYVYGLDLSLNSTGIAIFTNDGEFVKVLTVDTHSKKETRFKLEAIGEVFIRLLSEYTPEIIVIEEGFTRFNKSTQRIFKVHGVANYVFARYPQVYYPATTVKKIIAGKGNVEKSLVQEVIRERFPKIEFKNYDESDAFAVAMTYFIEKGIM